MLNFRKYNYHTWLNYIVSEFKDSETLGQRFLDIGASDGGFLKLLLENGKGKYGLGLDIVVPLKGLEKKVGPGGLLELRHADVCNYTIPKNLGTFDTVFFMNMFYVLPSLKEVVLYLEQQSIPNLIVTLPRANALNRYESRHPGANFITRNFEDFCHSIGYTIKSSSAVTNLYYLNSPISVLLGGLSLGSAKVIDNMGDVPFYNLIWLRKKGLKC